MSAYAERDEHLSPDERQPDNRIQGVLRMYEINQD